jgi:hypothetical protein
MLLDRGLLLVLLCIELVLLLREVVMMINGHDRPGRCRLPPSLSNWKSQPRKLWKSLCAV